MRIIEAGADDGARWDRYVELHADASFFHLYGWRRVLEQGLGHRAHYLIAEEAGAIVAVLPLLHVKSLLFGNSLSSLAFCSHAGTLASSDDARRAIEQAAHELAVSLKVGALEYRLKHPGNSQRVLKDLYETFAKPLAADAEANMQAIRSKQRNVIRKGIKNGLKSGIGALDSFYPVYAESVHNLGTPVFPRRLFALIEETFGNAVEYLNADHEGRVVSSAMNFYFRNTVCPYFWGGTHAARRLNANDFLAWEIMGRASERGCTVFDFGRSKKGTGSYEWKINLGFVPQPLYYEYDLIRDSTMPNVNPLNPKYRLLVEAWKKLPLPVATAVGPWIARALG